MPGSPTMPTARPRPLSASSSKRCKAATSSVRSTKLVVRSGIAPSRAARRTRNPDQAIGRDRLGFAFDRERPDRFDARIALRRQPGRLAQQDDAGPGRLLQMGGEVGGVADRRLDRKIAADRAEDDRAGVDADMDRQVEPIALGARRCLPPSAWRMPSAASKARRTWSSWVRGAPKIAMKPSPVNCGTVPS